MKFLILFLLFVHCLTIEHFISRKLNIHAYKYKTDFFSTKIDHFNFVDERTFKIKYLYNIDSWKHGGSIFFYTGNEGVIEAFAENSGLMWDLAQEFNAVLLFCEHRYYGDSKPFGNSSFLNRSKFGYLTGEQALADFALLINYFKGRFPEYKDAPVISFGGSYGGMLTSWFRQKYPNIVAGGLAASAPIFAFPGLSDCEGFSKVETSAFKKVGGLTCTSAIQRGFKVLKHYDTTYINSVFRICQPPISADSLINFILDYLGNIAMVNYPYPASFIGNLPAWPVKVFCDQFKMYTSETSDRDLLKMFSKAIHTLVDYGGPSKCLNTSDGSQTLDANGWYLQTCMEMTIPMCSDGIRDMFPPQGWNLDDFSNMCEKVYGVRPRTNWAEVQWWGRKLPSSLNNIIYSNGLLDPWSAYGVIRPDQAPGAVVILIPNGAHHLDLRASNPNDPEDVKRARKIYKNLFAKWIKEWYEKISSQV